MAIYYRTYRKYDQYVKQQGTKATLFADHVNSENGKRVLRFKRRFKHWRPFLRSGYLLCLGARTNCEVRGAKMAGFDRAVGMDLHPMAPGMVCGDWHNLPFATGRAASVFTNCLDHCYNLGEMMGEVHRVLRTGGTFLFETHAAYAISEHPWIDNVSDMMNIHKYNSMFWDDLDDVIGAICDCGFRLRHVNYTGKYDEAVFACSK